MSGSDAYGFVLEVDFGSNSWMILLGRLHGFNTSVLEIAVFFEFVDGTIVLEIAQQV